MQLTPQQEQVLSLISEGSTNFHAARSVGIHRNTIHNWSRSDPAFQLALVQARQARAAWWQELAEELTADALEAIHTLLTDPKTPPSVRFKAAQFILTRASSLPAIVETVHNSAQPAAAPPPAIVETVHNSAQPIATTPKTNDLCHCGSGLKFKRCCLDEVTLQAPLEVANQKLTAAASL